MVQFKSRNFLAVVSYGRVKASFSCVAANFLETLEKTFPSLSHILMINPIPIELF